jgi:hypothetical protein
MPFMQKRMRDGFSQVQAVLLAKFSHPADGFRPSNAVAGLSGGLSGVQALANGLDADFDHVLGRPNQPRDYCPTDQLLLVRAQLDSHEEPPWRSLHAIRRKVTKMAAIKRTETIAQCS